MMIAAESAASDEDEAMTLLRDKAMAPLRAYVIVAVISTPLLVAPGFLIDSRDPLVLIPLLCLLVFFPRQRLAKRLTRGGGAKAQNA